jgi:hypothetical protein
MLEMRAHSLEDVLGRVKEIQQVWNRTPMDPEELWFRGQPYRSQQLIPGLYRPEVSALGYDEVTIFERFKAWASPLVRRSPASDWEWYFLAQHHGLRTRLLDWTDNLLAAVFFALQDHIKGRTRAEVMREAWSPSAPPIYDQSSPAVWVMDAGTLNAASWGDYDCVFVTGTARTFPYLPDNINDQFSTNENPIAILTPRSSDRIVAQQGTFTLHGRARVPIEVFAEEHGVRIAMIAIDRANVAGVWDSLETCGIHRMSLFPDLDRVAEHILWVTQDVKMTKEVK